LNFDTPGGIWDKGRTGSGLAALFLRGWPGLIVLLTSKKPCRKKKDRRGRLAVAKPWPPEGSLFRGPMGRGLAYLRKTNLYEEPK
jgi:hypothetical protein